MLSALCEALGGSPGRGSALLPLSPSHHHLYPTPTRHGRSSRDRRRAVSPLIPSSVHRLTLVRNRSRAIRGNGLGHEEERDSVPRGSTKRKRCVLNCDHILRPSQLLFLRSRKYRNFGRSQDSARPSQPEYGPCFSLSTLQFYDLHPQPDT